MGCNESKPKAAAGNTITRKKSSRSNANGSTRNESFKSTKDEDIETVVTTTDNNGENQNTPLTVLHQQPEGDYDDDDVEVKDEEIKEVNVIISKDSPNYFFSSRRNEEALEGIGYASSENSDYDSPLRVVESNNGDEITTVKDIAIDDEKIVEEAEEEITEAQISNTSTGEEQQQNTRV